MADNAEPTGDVQLTFKVRCAPEGTHTLTMPESATVLELKTKLSGEEFESIPIERQRLIYSGRVMKNEDPLSAYKIKPGNTIHLVKSAASNPAAAPANSSAPAPPAVPANMAAGTSANNLLAGLTGARFAGHAQLPSAGIFGPDGGMNIPSEDQMADMLSNPALAQSMNEALSNPQFIDFMIQSNPMLRDMPNAREIIQSPFFRSMMTNPDTLRQAARMRRSMGGPGGSSFPAPGATDNTPAGAPASGTPGAADPNANPADMFGLQQFAQMFGGGGFPAGPGAQSQPGGNPANAAAFLSMLNAGAQAEAAANSGAAGGNAATGTPSSPPAGGQPGAANTQAQNPFAALFGPGGQPQITPELQQALDALRMGGLSPYGGFGGLGSPAPPDNRPPEERYADQLRQLNDMGFFDFDRNIEALRRSGGSVQGAIQHLLGD